MAANQKRTGFRFPWGGERREDDDLPAVPATASGAAIGTVLVEHRSRPAPISVPARPIRIDDGDDIGPGPFDVTADDDLASAEDAAMDEAEREEELEAAEALAEEEAVREALNWPQNDLDAKLSRKAAEDAETAAAIAAAEAAAESVAESVAVDEAVALAEAAEADAQGLTGTASAEAEPGAQDEPVAAEADEAVAVEAPATIEMPEVEPVVEADAHPAPTPIEVEPVVTPAPPPAPASAAPAVPAREPRRDNPLVANLVRAMRDAAAVARDEALVKVRADATTRVDEIRSRSTTRSVQLRKRSEEDVAAIKDWAKAEIARIRAEADDRIVGRKARLAREVEAHAEQTERRLAEVDATVEAFEAEMGTFFGALLAESDPTHLAALAERMPEAPAYAELPELDDEPAWTPPAPGESTRAFRDGPDDGDDPGPRSRRSRKRSTASDDDLAPLDVSETELEDADEAAATGDTTEIPADIAAILSDEETLAALAGLAAVEAMSRTAADAAIRAEMDAADAAESAKRAEEEAADAADAARRAEAASRPELDPLADPFLTDGEGGAPFGVAIESQTRVLVSGLGSIAAISAFKVALTGLPGVTSVNVTAAVDGEFVYSVTHAEYVDLRPLLVRLPGFTVTLRSDEGGILRVDAAEIAA